ncbi:MAG: hypothetical protein ACR2PS_10810, partial [Pseudomonadales bacterium]
DLIEQEISEIVDEFSRWHLSAVTIAASYHAGKFIQPHGVASRVYFPHDGTAYFRVDQKRYGLIKLTANDLIYREDFLDTYCQNDNIGVNARTVLLHNSHLSQTNTDVLRGKCFRFGHLRNANLDWMGEVLGMLGTHHE